MMKEKPIQRKKLNRGIVIGLCVLLLAFMYFSENFLSNYPKRILMLGAIYVVVAVGLNIIYGFTGMFSLGHYGFMAIGCYVAIVLALSPEQKVLNWYVYDIAPWLANIQVNYFVGILLGGLVAAFFAVLIGLPVLHLGDDYLGIATLGFAEIIRVLINNLTPITNGPLGIKGLPSFINIYWCFGTAILMVIIAVRLKKTSHGRALMAIRENEIAAQACGIKLTFHKVLAFVIGAFMAGVGGALLGYWSATVDPKMFSQILNFTILMIVVTGGLGSITGTVIMSFFIAISMEWLRFMEEPMVIFGWEYQGIAGMRMLVFAIVLLIVITKFKRGLFRKELSPSIFYTRPKILDKFSKSRGGGKW